MRTQKDWSRYIERLLVANEKRALATAGAIVRVQNQQLDLILQEIRKTIGSEPLTASIANTPLGYRERQELTTFLSAEISKSGLNYRVAVSPAITTLGAMQAKVAIAPLFLAVKEAQYSTSLFRSTFKSNSRLLNKKLAEALNKKPLPTLSSAKINQLLDTRWQGGTFSTRIWNNSNKLANSLPRLIKDQVKVKHSYQEIERALRGQFSTARSNSLRLVRTELNFMHNLSELESYLQNDIEYYKLLVTLDEKTSDICEMHAQENRTYSVKRAQVGSNYPPFHPNERTTTIPVFYKGERYSSVGKRSPRTVNNSGEIVQNTQLKMITRALSY